MVEVWMATPFEGGRRELRVEVMQRPIRPRGRFPCCRLGCEAGPVAHGATGQSNRRASAAEELHGKNMDAPFFADEVDRHDIGVVQGGRRADLVAESLQRLLLQRRRELQHFERDAPAHRKLFRFENCCHSAAAELANEAKVAYHLGRRRVDSGSWRQIDCRPRAMQQIDAGQVAGQDLP